MSLVVDPARRARAPRLLVLFALGLTAASCQGPAPEPVGRERTAATTHVPDGSAPGALANTTENASEGTQDAPDARPEDPDNPVVARAEGVEVTLAEYRRALQRGRLNGAPASERTQADVGFQRNLLTRLLKRARLREEASQRGLLPDRAALREYLARQPELAELASLDDAELERTVEQERGVSPEALWQFLEEDYLVERMTAVLLDEIDDEALWQRYAAMRTRIGLDVVRLLNVPSSEEISDFVRTRREEIAVFYAENRSRYAQPALATVRRFLVEVAPDADDATVRAARERAEEFRRRALTEDFAALAERHSDDLISRNSGGLLQPVSQGRMPAAFEVEIGEIGEVERTRAGFEFIKVESRTTAHIRELDPALEREIASELIQRAGPAPSVGRAGHAVLERWRQGAVADDDPELDALLRENRGERFSVPPFSLDGAGRIPKLGFLPLVHAAAAAATLEQPLSESPIADGSYVYVFRLTTREEADRLRFQAERDGFRAEVVARERPQILWHWFDRQLGQRVELDLRTIQAHYGLLQQDGSIVRE